MGFNNLANIIGEAEKGDFELKHVDKNGENTLYLLKNDVTLTYDYINHPLKDIYQKHIDEVIVKGGNVLVVGLGVGFVLFPLLSEESINSITVLELEQDVIDLMSPHLPDVNFIKGDARIFETEERYDSILLDIFSDQDELLKRYMWAIRYHSFANPGGYVNYMDFEEFYKIGVVGSHDTRYKIELDVDVHVHHKGVKNINYKSELRSGTSYTPVYIIHSSGEKAGFLEKTEYYKNFVDDNNKGELVLVVEESYTIDNSNPNIPHTAKPSTERTKKWKYVKKDGTMDEDNIKTKTKKYNTRRKRHIEAEKRRANVLEQLIDHVGLAGVLSGAFSDPDDAYDKLTAMQELHAAAFTGWMTSGRGSLADVVKNDATTAWLDTVIPDNATTQAMCSWMIGFDFRQYIQDKLKGNIK